MRFFSTCENISSFSMLKQKISRQNQIMLYTSARNISTNDSQDEFICITNQNFSFSLQKASIISVKNTHKRVPSNIHHLIPTLFKSTSSQTFQPTQPTRTYFHHTPIYVRSRSFPIYTSEVQTTLHNKNF